MFHLIPVERVCATTTNGIQRIIGDKSCLCYFVQFLEQKFALPLIKFWLDAESFKTSANLCIESDVDLRKGVSNGNISIAGGRHRRVKSLSGKSNSFEFDAISGGDDESQNSASDHVDSVECSAMTRDSGDGSSDVHSMTNLSDICEHDDEVDGNANPTRDLSEEHDADTVSIREMDGRKSAIGASSDDGDVNESQRPLNRKANIHASLALDAMRIFKKYLLNRESPNYVDVPATILSQISLALCYDRSVSDASPCFSSSTPSISSIFNDAQSYILRQLDTTYTNAFLESPFYCRYCVEVLSSDTLRIGDILHNETALFYFMEFIETDGRRRYLDFWLAAMNFKRQLSDASLKQNECDDNENFTQQAQSDALILYEKYISLQATCPLHLPDRVRFQIEEKICPTDDGNKTICCCFDLALSVIERFFELKYLHVFVKSPLFSKYLTEMWQKSDASKHNKNDTRNISLKPRKSISSQNTLLAMESHKSKSVNGQSTAINQRIRTSSTSDMSIDSRQLSDPDLLWQRPSLVGLNFGRVDALGRYERDYEMIPFGERNNIQGNGHTVVDTGIAALQQTGNKFKQAVRRLVNLPEEKIQEEIAWKMAEMIVNGVTSVTLQPANASSERDDLSEQATIVSSEI